jgi:hypothetical protein
MWQKLLNTFSLIFKNMKESDISSTIEKFLILEDLLICYNFKSKI